MYSYARWMTNIKQMVSHEKNWRYMQQQCLLTTDPVILACDYVTLRLCPTESPFDSPLNNLADMDATVHKLGAVQSKACESLRVPEGHRATSRQRTCQNSTTRRRAHSLSSTASRHDMVVGARPHEETPLFFRSLRVIALNGFHTADLNPSWNETSRCSPRLDPDYSCPCLTNIHLYTTWNVHN
jgi:hypothetical protein